MFENSVFEVTSRDPDNPNAGTAFAVDRVASTTYLVTCAHVIKAVGPNQACVDGVSARVEALGDPEGPVDLAVLAAELPDTRPLRLSPSTRAGGESTVIGYTSVVGGVTVARSQDALASLSQMRSIPALLADRTRLRRSGRSAVSAWVLTTREDLTEGISGGPVIDSDSREVVGVASLSFFGQGKAIAIAVDALQALWPTGINRLQSPRLLREIEFVPIPGGTFQMGTGEGRAAELAQLKTAGNFLSETPAALVQVSGYYISRHVITNSQYAEFARATGHRVPHAGDGMSQQFNWHAITRRPPEGKHDFPVVLVSWDDAVAYCEWLGGRLPTEAEWEKAARGTDGREWPWGDQWDPARCNTMESFNPPHMTAAGSFSPSGDSPYQVADMSGNVWEWCASVIVPYPYQSADGRESRAALGQRVIRGGSWGEGRYRCRCASRNATKPDDMGFTIGFRVVLDADSDLLFEGNGL